MSEKPDLAGYPILRLDQILIIDSQLLRDAEAEVYTLIGKLRDETSSQSQQPALVPYLQRQIEVMKNELARRAANERVQALLLGAADVFTDYNSISSSSSLSSSSKNSILSSTLSTMQKNVSQGEDESIDGRIGRRGVASAPAISSTGSGMMGGGNKISKGNSNSNNNSSSSSILSSVTGDLSSQSHTSSVITTNTDLNGPSSPSQFSTRSGPEADRHSSSLFSDSYAESPPSGNTSQRRRPLSGGNQPSRRSLMALNATFGSAFVVAATEKKKRFYPKKMPAETPEEIRERERIERRKIAMKRLMDRREEQQALRARKKSERKRLEIEAAKAKRSSSFTQQQGGDKSLGNKREDVHIESSDEESVSGDDQEGPGMIDPVMLQRVEQALEQVEAEREENVDVNQASDQPKQFQTQEMDPHDTFSHNTLKENPLRDPNVVVHDSSDSEIHQSQVTRNSRTSEAKVSIANLGKSSGKMKRPPRKSQEPKVKPPSVPISIRGGGGSKSKTQSLPPNSGATLNSMENTNYEDVNTPTPGESTEIEDSIPRPPQVKVMNEVKVKHPTRNTSSSSKPPSGPISIRGGGGRKAKISSSSSASSSVFAGEANLSGNDEDGDEVSSLGKSSEISHIPIQRIEQTMDRDINVDAEREENVHAFIENLDVVQPTDDHMGCEQENLDQSDTIVPVTSKEDAHANHHEDMTGEVPPADSYSDGQNFGKSKGDAIQGTSTEDEISTVPNVHSNTLSYVLDGDVAAKNMAALGALRMMKLKKDLSAGKPSKDREGGFEGEVPNPRLGENVTETSEKSRETIKFIEKTSAEDNFDGNSAAKTSPRKRNIESDTQTTKRGQNLPPQTPRTESVKSRMYAKQSNSLQLITMVDGVYHSSLGPDELPGLRAWALATVQNGEDSSTSWSLDLNSYFEPIVNDSGILRLRQQRASSRRPILFGLVRLAMDCETLLLGGVYIKDEEHFSQLWRDALQYFDAQVASLGDEESQKFFEQVTVCGNCYAVCRKLENLLKTNFVTKMNMDGDNNSYSYKRKNDSATLLSNPVSTYPRPYTGIDNFDEAETKAERDFPHDGSFSTSRKNSFVSSLSPRAQKTSPAHNQSFLYANHEENVADEEDDDESPILPDYYSIPPQGRSSRLIHTPPEKQRERFLEARNNDEQLQRLKTLDDNEAEEAEIVEKDDDSIDDGGGDGMEDEDEVQNEDESNKRIETNKVKDSLKHQPSTAEQRLIDHLAITEDSTLAKASKEKFRRAIEPSSSTPMKGKEQNNNIKAPKLSDFYTHIGMIFPIAYSTQGPKQAEGISARALIESMQIQGKLYEEWLEVMSDYATVFSQERGVKGNMESVDNGSSLVYKGGTRALHYKIKSSRPEVVNIVSDVFNNILHGWEQLPSGLGLGMSWNLLWTWQKPRLNMNQLLTWQRVNHFHDSKQLTRKDLLKKNLQRFTDMTGKVAEAFEIMPQTFLLPHEYTQFVKVFTEIEASRVETKLQNYWIMKPVGMSRGRGISLVRDVASLTYSSTSVVQRYVERPLCLDGYKFDLRIFVLVTSFKPLEAFIYREGFARVSTQSYSLDPSQMGNKFVHLTNSSIQKQNTEGPSADNPLRSSSADVGGSKICMHGAHGLWARLEAAGINTEILWRNICLVVLKSLVVVDEKMTYQPCSFEVFGYDVLIDSDLRPWLIEVNASPSLARENSLDVRIKNAMIRDTILLVDPAPYDRAAVARILKKRLQDISKNKFTMNKNDPDLESDLREIFGPDYMPRRYGEDPKYVGDYQKLCPNTKIYDHILKLKGKIIKPI